MTDNKKDMFDSAIVKLDFLSKNDADFKKAVESLDKKMGDDAAKISVASVASVVANKSKNSK